MVKKTNEFMPEKEYILSFGVDAYNRKYNRKLDYKTCHVKSVHKVYGYAYGYQIETIRGDDHVVIMLYFNMGELTREHNVRVELVQNLDIANALGDEVYVVTGEVAKFYKEQGIYRFRWIQPDDFTFSVVMFADSDLFQFMDSSFMTWMSETPAPPFP